MQKTILLNENGRRVGESHPGAKLSDAEVNLVLELHEEGYGYDWLAQKFDVSKSCIRWICTARNRSQTVARAVRVSVD